MGRSAFDQLDQVRGTLVFFDDMHQSLAENCGRYYHTGAITLVSGSNVIVDSSTIIEKNEVDNFIVVDTGDAAGIYQIDSANGTVSGTISTVASGSAVNVSYRRHYNKNLEDDLNYLRRMFDLVIGEDKWNEDPDTNLHEMSYLIPKRPNYLGETGQYTDRPGTVSFAIDDINQTGYVSTGAPAGEYTDNTSSTTAGTSLRFTDDNTIVISVASNTGGFYPADKGTLNIYRDGAVVGTLNLATAWTNDNCSYEEEESDVGNNPNHTSSGAGTDIINLTHRRCMNTTVDGYPSFWPAYQIASMNATLTLPNGFQGQIYIAHTDGGGNQNYTYSSFWVDVTSQTINATAPVINQDTPVTRYLSGVPYYTTNSTFTISGTNSDTLFDRGYVTNPMTFNVSEFNDTSITPSLAQIGLSNPTAITDTIANVGGHSSTITVGAGNFRDMDARATATYRNVFTNATSAVSNAGTYRIDTYGITSTNTVENFDDEDKRFLGNEDFTDTGITWSDSNWVSSTSILTQTDPNGDGGLVMYNGTLKYPTINHSSGFLPAGPNYSGASGDFVLYRVFIGSAAFTQGSIIFNGWANALSTIQGSNVEVFLRYPNCTDYSNNNTNVWQDLGVAQTIYGGNGCLGNGSSGNTVAFSFGTESSVSYGNRIIMWLKIKSSSITALNSITFSPIV